MSAEYGSKGLLLALMREGENAKCFDCKAPSLALPRHQTTAELDQAAMGVCILWVNFNKTFICLSCSGQHRGLGVHISFVRSITMDKWTDAQVAKMQNGGNQKCREFFQASGEYKPSLSIPEVYNSHYATQYRDKLAAECEGRTWDPSQTPPPAVSENSSSALRKPRALGGRAPSPLPQSTSPVGSRSGTPVDTDSFASNSKATVDTAFFGRLGDANASRSDSLRPSEGGKYGGFGSEGSWTPSQATSSKALPTLDDLKTDPTAALSRGWGFFSAALGQATKQINETVVQPGLARATDPSLQANLSSYVSTASRTLGEGARQGGSALSHALRAGGEFAESKGLAVGDMGASYIDRIAHATDNDYNTVAGTSPNAWQSHTPQDQDFFASHTAPAPLTQTSYGSTATSQAKPKPAVATKSAITKPKPAAADDWDDFGSDNWGKND